jgi:hypothetical protein
MTVNVILKFRIIVQVVALRANYNCATTIFNNLAVEFTCIEFLEHDEGLTDKLFTDKLLTDTGLVLLKYLTRNVQWQVIRIDSSSEKI